MSDNIVDIFKNVESSTEAFRGFEKSVDQWMNLIGIEEAIRKIVGLDFDTEEWSMPPGEDITFKTRLLFALRYIRPALAILDVPLPNTRLSIVVSQHDDSITTVNILLNCKTRPEPIILQTSVLQYGEWGDFDSEETAPCNLNHVGYDMIYNDLIANQDRMVTMGAAKKSISKYELGELEYHRSTYTYLAKDLGFQAIVAVLGLIDETDG